MKRTQLLLAVTLGLVIIGLVIGGAAAHSHGVSQTATGDDTADATEKTENLETTALNSVCESEDTMVLGVTAKSAFEGSEPLYPGTQLSIVVCQAGERLDRDSPTGWSLDEGNIYVIDGSTEDSVTITITEGEDVDLAKQIVGVSPDNEFILRTPRENLYHGGEDRLLNASIRFQSTAAHNDFVENESRYLDAVTAIDNLVEKIDASRDEISVDSDPGDVKNHAKLLENLSNQQTEIKYTTTNMEHLLHSQAMNHIRAKNTVAAVETLHEQHGVVDEQTDESATTSREELEGIENEIQSSIRTNIGIGLLGGLLFGVAIGVVGLYRKGREVDDFYQVSSQNELTKSVLKLPWIVGTLLVIGGLGVMVWFGLLGVIV